MSGKRREILAIGETYHVFNRAVGSEEILKNKKELERCLELINYYRFSPKLSFSKYKKLPESEKTNYLETVKKLPKVVDIYSFVLMPTHFHLLVKQLEENGIRKFLSNFQNGFAKYFNAKNKRSGTLFQEPFKSKRVSSEEILLHLSRYIHLNPITSFIIKPEEISSYKWSSYISYIQRGNNDLVDTKLILSLAGSREKYSQFVLNQVDYQRRLHIIKSFM